MEPLLKRVINQELITKNWDDMLRVAASIKTGWVTASLLVSRLQSYSRKSQLLLALQEYGRLQRTIFTLKYLGIESYRSQIRTQLNKGEAIHYLRQYLFFANEGTIRKASLEDQENQAGCLTLVTNAVIVWNTRYIAAIVEQLKNEGYQISDEDISHVSPCRFEHINKYGHYNFDIEKEMRRKYLRPFRNTQIP